MIITEDQLNKPPGVRPCEMVLWPKPAMVQAKYRSTHMRYFNGNGRLTANLAHNGYEFSVNVDAIRKVKADCIKGLRRRSIGGYVEILRLDYTDNR